MNFWIFILGSVMHAGMFYLVHGFRGWWWERSLVASGLISWPSTIFIYLFL